MDECGSGNLLAKIECILTYGGSGLDIAINYALLVFDVTFCAWWLNIAHQNARKPCISLIAVMIYQVVLCLFLGCSGVSIVWCAVLGWYIQKSRCQSQAAVSPQNKALVSKAEIALEALNASALTYYAITSAMITSVAHGCAVLLGMGLSKLESCCGCCSDQANHQYHGFPVQESGSGALPP
eukprot:s131_g27.t1